MLFLCEDERKSFNPLRRARSVPRPHVDARQERKRAKSRAALESRRSAAARTAETEQDELHGLIQAVAELEADWYLGERERLQRRDAVAVRREGQQFIERFRAGKRLPATPDVAEARETNRRINRVLEDLHKEFPLE